jgi:hypothetical protein
LSLQAVRDKLYRMGERQGVAGRVSRATQMEQTPWIIRGEHRCVCGAQVVELAADDAT